MENEKFLIRAAMLYDFKQGKSAAESHRTIISAFGDGSISESQCRKWFQRFQSGNENLQDVPHERHPQGVTGVDLLAEIEEIPALTTRELAEMFDVSHTTIENHLHRVGKKSRCVDDRL